MLFPATQDQVCTLAENNHLYFGNHEDQLAKHLLNREKKKAALLFYLQDIFCLLLLNFFIG